MIRQPRQSRTWVSGWEGGPFPFPVSRFPTSTILPSRTVTSARSTRHSPSCSSTSPPASSRSGVSECDGTASGRDARLGAGRVVRQVEVDTQLFQQVVFRVHARQDALRSAGIDQQVPVGIVETRQEDGAARVVGERDVDGFSVGGEQLDAARFQRGCDLLRVILQVVEGVGAVLRGHGVRRAQPEQDHARLRHHPRGEQGAVGRVLWPDPREFQGVTFLRHPVERPSAARGHAQKRYQRADSHGWEYIRPMGAAEYGGGDTTTTLARPSRVAAHSRRFKVSHEELDCGVALQSWLGCCTLDKHMASVIQSIAGEYRRYKALAEGALAQLSDGEICAPAPGGGNSIATICWHISGNLRSRFTDFLTSDGEKPWRNREEEFQARSVARAELLAHWEQAWSPLLTTMEALDDPDLGRTVTIRGQALGVAEALHRSLAHTSYHVGQVLYAARASRGAAWRFLSIPPGQSAAFNGSPGLQKPDAQAAWVRRSSGA